MHVSHQFTIIKIDLKLYLNSVDSGGSIVGSESGLPTTTLPTEFKVVHNSLADAARSGWFTFDDKSVYAERKVLVIIGPMGT